MERGSQHGGGYSQPGARTGHDLARPGAGPGVRKYTPSIDPRRIALIGFGEVGGLFARGLIASGRHDVSAYDVLMDGGAALREKARALGVEACASAPDAARDARIVISAVTAAAARGVAEAAAGYMRPGQTFLDVNSVSPETKRASAAAVERSGAAYVEAAVDGSGCALWLESADPAWRQARRKAQGDARSGRHGA